MQVKFFRKIIYQAFLMSQTFKYPSCDLLTFKSRYYRYSSKIKSSSNNEDNFWKSLNIELMKNQLQIQGLSKNSQNQLREIFQAQKKNLIDALEKIIKDLQVYGIGMQQQLQSFEMTSKKLIQEFQHINKTILDHKYQEQSGFVDTHFYHSLSRFMKDLKLYPHLSPLGFIMEIYIKFSHLISIKDRIFQSSILNNSPQQYKQVWEKVNVIAFDQKKLQKDYSRLKTVMHIAIGILQGIKVFNQKLSSIFLQLPYSFLEGSINYKKKILRSYVFFNRPNALALKLINTLQKGKIGQLIELTLPKIKTNRMIYIPAHRHFDDIIDIFKPNEHAIPVRVLFNKELPSSTKNEQPIEEALIHMHGGGAMLFTSFISQNHTRIWANQTGLLIFSIDYKLAPDHPFPEGLNDCLQVYKFLTQEIYKYFNIKLKRTFIGGDSIGGNLSCALTGLILKHKLLIPKGIFLVYPSLDMRKIYYQSRQYTLIDPMLWPSLAILAIDSYVRNISQSSNPFVSPLLLTEQDVGGEKGDKSFPKQWPRTSIMVGTKDPLRDQSLLFMQRMELSGIDYKCLLLQGFRHGFMNTEKYIRQSDRPFKMSIQIIKELIQKGKKQ